MLCFSTSVRGGGGGGNDQGRYMLYDKEKEMINCTMIFNCQVLCHPGDSRE